MDKGSSVKGEVRSPLLLGKWSQDALVCKHNDLGSTLSTHGKTLPMIVFPSNPSAAKVEIEGTLVLWASQSR